MGCMYGNLYKDLYFNSISSCVLFRPSLLFESPAFPSFQNDPVYRSLHATGFFHKKVLHKNKNPQKSQTHKCTLTDTESCKGRRIGTQMSQNLSFSSTSNFLSSASGRLRFYFTVLYNRRFFQTQNYTMRSLGSVLRVLCAHVVTNTIIGHDKIKKR